MNLSNIINFFFSDKSNKQILETRELNIDVSTYNPYVDISNMEKISGDKLDLLYSSATSKLMYFRTFLEQLHSLPEEFSTIPVLLAGKTIHHLKYISPVFNESTSIEAMQDVEKLLNHYKKIYVMMLKPSENKYVINHYELNNV